MLPHHRRGRRRVARISEGLSRRKSPAAHRCRFHPTIRSPFSLPRMSGDARSLPIAGWVKRSADSTTSRKRRRCWVNASLDPTYRGRLHHPGSWEMLGPQRPITAYREGSMRWTFAATLLASTVAFSSGVQARKSRRRSSTWSARGTSSPTGTCSKCRSGARTCRKPRAARSPATSSPSPSSISRARRCCVSSRPASTTSPPRCRSTSTTAAPSSRRSISPVSPAPSR